MKETIDLILPLSAEFEGFRSKVYKCPAGFDTMGFGRNIEANPLSIEEKVKLNPDGSVSEAVAREWLREYLEKCYKELDEAFVWFSKMDCVRKAALVDFDYNVGLGTLKSFKNTLRFFECGDYKQAAENMHKSKWFAQVKRRGVKICAMVENGQIKVSCMLDYGSLRLRLAMTPCYSVIAGRGNLFSPLVIVRNGRSK